MGTLYMAVPRATSAPFDIVEVATTTALKTVLQIGIPSTTDIRVHAWSISFDGIAAGDAPINASLVDTATASTAGTSLTPETWEVTGGVASLCVGGTALTAYNLTSPTETAVRFLDAQEVHPQTGYTVFFPESRHPAVKASRFLKIRTLAAVTVNCIPWILYEEPS
jgi:hypothetical protein